jgi:hypothetical protein
LSRACLGKTIIFEYQNGIAKEMRFFTWVVLGYQTQQPEEPESAGSPPGAQQSCVKRRRFSSMFLPFDVCPEPVLATDQIVHSTSTI